VQLLKRLNDCANRCGNDKLFDQPLGGGFSAADQLFSATQPICHQAKRQAELARVIEPPELKGVSARPRIQPTAADLRLIGSKAIG
jgi:hypothetical protein